MAAMSVSRVAMAAFLELGQVCSDGCDGICTAASASGKREA